jgi:hypothetical protein
LLRTTVSSEAVALSIVGEAKVHARAVRSTALLETLDREKSLLIKDINHTFGGDDFYDQQVENYRMYATIQTLFNDWRDPKADVGRVGQYEDQLVKWLLSEKTSPTETPLTEDSPGSARLLMKVLTKKLNDKWSTVLNESQKELVRAYALSSASDDPETITKKLNEIQGKLLVAIDAHVAMHPGDTFVNDKMSNAREKIVAEDVQHVDDDTVTRFMLYTKLCDELNGDEDEKN